MAFFRRSKGAPTAAPAQHPVISFWQWWAAEGHQIDPTKPSKATDALSERLGVIHPDLTWQFGAGEGSRHCLTVSSGGVAQVRPLAERWLRAAPRPDETWEFRSSQQRDPNALTNVLEIAGHRLDLSDTRFHVESDADDLRIHVGVHHPAYASLAEEVRGQVTFLLLDWLLGEDDVERWVGHVESLTEAPAGLVIGREVVAAVSDIAAQREPDEWTMGQWEDRDGAPGLAMFRRGVRWIDHPMLDRHQVLSAGYAAQDNGLPADSTVLDQLRHVESELESVLGSRGLIVAIESHRGVRTCHAYTDGDDQNVDAALAEAAPRWGATLAARPDPAWTEVRQFTG